jgi:hypothetical protein
MACTDSGVERSRSVSSMRNIKTPWLARACSQANRAVRAPPTCKKPVGLGAKRVLIVIWILSILENVYFATDSNVVQENITAIKKTRSSSGSFCSIGVAKRA